jgi:alanine racemase
MAASKAAATMGKKARLHVKVDTGMGRLGLRTDEAAEVVERISDLPHIEIAAVWSHFATADEEDQTYARKQLTRFQQVLAEIGKRGITIPLRHMANSAGILTLPDAHFDMVRPGIMLYGVPPRKNMQTSSRLVPVMSLVSFVSFLKEVEAGAGISYGRTFVTRNRTRIATVPVGYADGYFRGLSNRSHVLIRGARYPVVGTVSMDQIMVEVGIDSPVAENDVVTLIGKDGNEEITAHELADILGTIPYEIMCAVSSRVARVVVPD